MLLRFLINVIHLYSTIIVLEVVLSWVHSDPCKLPRSVTHKLTEPVLAPFRAILPPRHTGGVDLAPVLVFLLLVALRRSITTLAAG